MTSADACISSSLPDEPDRRIRRCMEILTAHSIPFSESRFPFTYHHDWQRSTSGRSRGDEARALREDYRSPRDRVDAAIRGAVIYLLYTEGVACRRALDDSAAFRAFVSTALGGPGTFQRNDIPTCVHPEETRGEIVIQNVFGPVTSDAHWVALSDGDRLRLYDATEVVGLFLRSIAAARRLELPVFIASDDDAYSQLAAYLTAPAGRGSEPTPLMHALPVGARQEESGPLVGRWVHKLYPATFRCPRCRAPYPAWGNYDADRGGCTCHACGHQELRID